MAHRRFHRAVFGVAGAYNVGWGIYSALDPNWLFRFARMAPMNQPAVFSCLGMVVGLYGLIYWEIARLPERGWLLAAVGLAGKVLGPIGLGVLLVRGEWPPATLVLCITNDFVWWVPFAIYLVDAWPAFRAGGSGARAPSEAPRVHPRGSWPIQIGKVNTG
jgi:hypothetical protein